MFWRAAPPVPDIAAVASIEVCPALPASSLCCRRTWARASDIDSIDRIQGFEVGIDKLQFDSASFALAAGTLNPARFYHWGDTVTQTGSVFIYRMTDGALFWDSNGSGAGGLTAVAYLNGIPSISAADFIVV